MKTDFLTLAGVTLSATPAFATSDRPLRMRANDVHSPYADVTERDRVGALSATQLPRAPGAQWEQSKFRDDVLPAPSPSAAAKTTSGCGANVC